MASAPVPVERSAAAAALLSAPFAVDDYVHRKSDGPVWEVASGGAPCASSCGRTAKPPKRIAFFSGDEVYVAAVGDDDYTVISRNELETEYELAFPKIRIARSAFGFGVFAREAIAVGDALLWERPLLTARTDKEAELLFYGLSLPDQEAFMALNDPECAGDDMNDHLDRDAGGLKTTRNEKSVASVTHNNAIPNGKGVGVPDGSLYALICRFNHGCAPHVRWRWNKRSGIEEIIAVRNVSVGTELLASYTEQFVPHSERQASLMKNFYFACRCELCAAASTPAGASDSTAHEVLAAYARGCRVREVIRILQQATTRGAAAADTLEAMHEEALQLCSENSLFDESRVVLEALRLPVSGGAEPAAKSGGGKRRR